MILRRCFTWDEQARSRAPGGPIWFARPYQGDGRHDNPASYGCLYASESETAAVVEQLAQFQGSVFVPGMLTKRGLPLALASIDLSDSERLIDLDDPGVLVSEALRPSLVATYRRAVTQPQALELFGRHPDAAGLRWWSTREALWANYTIFDRARTSLRLVEVRALTPDDPAVVAATDFLGMSA